MFEPGADGAGLDDYVELACPYCGESLTLPLDLPAGDQSYIEDCHVCCQPMAVSVSVDGEGRLRGVTARRGDE